MDQMNVSLTDQLAGFVRQKVSSGRYNNASEVVREALRRMEEDDLRAERIAAPTVEDVLADLDTNQLEAIRSRVRTGIQQIENRQFSAVTGPDGLRAFAHTVKTRGRKRLAADRRS